MIENNWMALVHHDGSPRYVLADEPGMGDSVTFKVRTGLDSPIERIFLRTSPDGEQKMAAMRHTYTDATSQWWETEIILAMPRTNYRFLLLTHTDGGWWLNADGITRHTPTDANDFKLLARHSAPAWVHQTIFYQIFPDRFADGDPDSNVKEGEYQYNGKPVVARKWGELPNPKSGGIEFFGGDLPGITQKLDYLQDLGVTALYLNPIFTAPSNHKYDVADYRQVDPHLGGDGALIQLREELDRRGMHLILDIVPNHCGATNQWFLDAQADLDAPTGDFFTFHHWPADYEAWFEIPSLPKLNYRSEKLRQEMYASENAIMRYWLRPPFRVDGWRLDVANMLARQGENQFGHKIGRGVRRAVKAENPQAYLLGENFFDGTPHLQGEELDATMNYRGFMLPLLRWLSGFETAVGAWADTVQLPTEGLAAQWLAFLVATPWQVANQQFNLLGSHDTPRIFTAVNENVALLKVAVAILFSYPGVPSIYYGDEVGLPGGRDPDCRRCMPWNPADWNLEINEFYRQLIKLRRESLALQQGGFQILYAANHTIAYQRELSDNDRLIIVAKRESDAVTTIPVLPAGIADGTRLREFFTGVETTISNGQLDITALVGPNVQIWLPIS